MSTKSQLPKKIFNVAKSDYHLPEIILGDDPGLLDSIHTHYPKMWELYKRLKMLDWDELEFDFSTCLVEFETCDKSTYDMMIKTLAWQWEADSVASRSIVNILSPVMTDSRVWAGYVRINDNEDVHALTYSEIVRNSFKDPKVILDEILRVEEAQERMVAVARTMGEAHDAVHAYALNQVPNDQELYNKVFMFFIALYFLERIQFMASFAVTFAIGRTGAFQQIAAAVKKIAQDEFEIHAQYGQEVIRALLATERGKLAYSQCKDKIIELLWEIVKTEVTWVNYLFSEGRELTGVNATKLINWVLFNANAAATFLSIENDVVEQYQVEFKESAGFDFVWPEKNPLLYMEDYLDISSTQASPQEEEKPDYMVNVVNDVGEEEEFEVDFL
ncbi:ribonucleoside diphosphate reductase small subunit [Pseudomonas phage vB_Pae10145-KEN51]|uniref:ribonucleoside-diphosphate reductase n=1 Tax=Pseudomonas phage fnug TaxID=2719836 RepID=A0A6H2A9S6_9CAUD|nr:putative ribonucleotide reductase beta subunit [Pseudomonas phage fnug]QOV08198.1 putative ribonucleoside-diphosphate reductase 1 subunit beta [Pseudomonas phage vB_PaeM_kmuB]UNI71877.1 putative ribonucleotide reductase beta subunit [Pseudomonas phage Churi01]WNV50372.1 ribonucleotide reductase of class Ia (aerobic), beta subunit [Pseudomonas phage PhiPizzaParty]WPJ69490.1 ribonucleotide reductase of class ia aerobic [Pseudomonas phage PA_ZH1]BBI55925.1 Ribonucleotide reductase of class Ia 